MGKKFLSTDMKTYADVIKNYKSPTRYEIHNASCLVCGVTEGKMIRVGSLTFCKHCDANIWKTDDPVRKENELYKIYLVKYYKELDND